MIDKRTIFEIHRLAHEGLSVRKIATILGLSQLCTKSPVIWLTGQLLRTIKPIFWL